MYARQPCVWGRSGVFVVNFEHISHLFLVFLLLHLNMQLPAGRIHISRSRCPKIFCKNRFLKILQNLAKNTLAQLFYYEFHKKTEYLFIQNMSERQFFVRNKFSIYEIVSWFPLRSKAVRFITLWYALKI